jgi:hypothetical protein
MKTTMILRILLGLMISISCFGSPGESVIIENNLSCYQDESGSFLVRTNSNRYKDLLFNVQLRKYQNEIKALQLKKIKSIPNKVHKSINNKINNKRLIIRKIKDCRAGTLITNDSPAANYIEACKVIGSHLPSETSAIINGDRCLIGDSPTVRLRLINNTEEFEASCSGTLISPTVVVTAAHCLVDSEIVSIITASGEYPTSSFQAHPSYNPNSNTLEDHDFGIVIASSPLTNRIASLLNTNDLLFKEEVIIGGYGLFSIRENGISTKFNGVKSNTCSGDSGGPLYVKRGNSWLLAAITSNGIKANCTAGDISGFGNLTSSSARDFIDNFISLD